MANEKVSFKLGDYINLPESPNIELGALYLAKTTNDSGHLYYGLSRDKLLPVVSMNPQFANGLKIATGIKQDLYVPEGTTGALGAVKQHKAENCTTYTSDDGATTPAAVKKLFNSFYADCGTPEATTEKTVTCQPFVLVTGARIIIKFTRTNTAINPTLNVNSTGAKPIYYEGNSISAGVLKANSTYEFVYNGDQYELIGELGINVRGGVQIGNGVYTWNGVAIGTNANSDGVGAIAIGLNAMADSEGSIAIGCSSSEGDRAWANAANSIQLGRGKNTKPGSLQFKEYTIMTGNGAYIAYNYGTSAPSATANTMEGELYFQIID